MQTIFALISPFGRRIAIPPVSLASRTWTSQIEFSEGKGGRNWWIHPPKIEHGSPENKTLEKEIPFGIMFMHVKFQESIGIWNLTAVQPSFSQNDPWSIRILTIRRTHRISDFQRFCHGATPESLMGFIWIFGDIERGWTWKCHLSSRLFGWVDHFYCPKHHVLISTWFNNSLFMQGTRTPGSR